MLQGTPLGGLHGNSHDRASQMHERGHSYYGTACPDRCAKVDAWAARRLITPRAMLDAARPEHRIEAIAATLRVTPEIVRAYIASLDVDELMIMQRLVGHELR